MLAMKRVLGIGLAWGVLWLVVATALGTVIGIVDPDSIDPGDWQGMISIYLALVLCAFGGIIAVIWLFLSRRWASWRSAVPVRSSSAHLGE